MKSYVQTRSGFVVLLGMLMALGGINGSEAGVQEEFNFKVPSAVILHGPHPVVMIPGTHIYMVPDIDVSILFYHDHWYRSCEGSWFRADSYSGPWVYLKPIEVPLALTELPEDYRREMCG